MITSRDNRRLKAMRRTAAGRGDPGVALLEGPHLIRAALDAGLALESVLATRRFLQTEAGEVMASAIDSGLQEADPALLDELADADSPRGIVALCRLPVGGIEGIPSLRDGIYLFLDGVQDPGNVGAIARAAEAAGATALVLGPGTARGTHPRALRGSAGSLLRLPWCEERLDPLLHHLAPVTPTILSLDPHRGVDLYAEYESPPGTVVLLLGAEGGGVSPVASERTDERIRIPMQPPVESLNVAVAAAVVLYELRRRRTAESLRHPGPVREA